MDTSKLIVSSYVIMSRDRKYIVTGKGYDVTMALTNRSWRPRMFKAKNQALSLFTSPYNWSYCSTKPFDIGHYLLLDTEEDKKNYYKRLLDNYFDIVKIGIYEEGEQIND